MTQKDLPDNLQVNVLEWEEKNSRQPIYWKFSSFFKKKKSGVGFLIFIFKVKKLLLEVEKSSCLKVTWE